MRASKVYSCETKVYKGWLEERFGDHFAQISVDTTLKLKSAVRDVARMRRGDIPIDIEILCKRLKMPPQGISDYDFVMGYSTDEGEVKGSIEPGHADADLALQQYAQRYPLDWDIVKKCLGLGRQKGRHACAFVVANRPIKEFIPLTRISDVVCTQFTAPSVEAVGGLKMDFLVVNSLKDIQDCVRLVQQRHCHEPRERGWLLPRRLNSRLVPGHRLVPVGNAFVDIWDLPEDQAVFKDVAEGRTETVFQFNTSGAVGWLTYFNRDRPDGTKAIRAVEDMAAFTALDRPGPLDVLVMNPENDTSHNMLVEYARRAAGDVGSPDVLSVLEELVPETHGVMCYQEQMQRVYQQVTGCSMTDAETFRIYVSKKKMAKVDACYAGFMEAASVKLGAENAQKLWDFIKTWGQYGFNKSHAVCYAVIAYACAYLKHHFPLEWWCAVLRNASKDDVNKMFWRHVSDIIDLPDIKVSGDNWEIQGDRIRAPINLLNGIGETAHAQLYAGAPYASLDDFCNKILEHQAAGKTTKTVEKTDSKTGETKTVLQTTWGRSPVNRGVVRSLIVSGAMDSLLPQGGTLDKHLDKFEQAFKDAHKRYDKKYAKAKAQEIPPDALGIYQLRKSVLPAYGEDIRPILAGDLPPFLDRTPNGLRYHWGQWDRNIKSYRKVIDPVVGPTELAYYHASPQVPEDGWRAAVIAYLEDTRLFQYGQNKEKEAVELTLDVGGDKYSLVHWPDYDGKLPADIRALKPGTVVAAILLKTSSDKPFAVRELRVVRPPLEKTKKDDNDE